MKKWAASPDACTPGGELGLVVSLSGGDAQSAQPPGGAKL
jgi:hypothetical protein